MAKFEYNILVEREESDKYPKESKLIDWGNESGWLEGESRELLDTADRISLVHKKNPLKIVTVRLDGTKRFTIFSKVYGKINNPQGTKKEIRIYCIGWQDTIKGVNVKSLNWIYPNGMVENSEEPNYMHHFV